MSPADAWGAQDVGLGCVEYRWRGHYLADAKSISIPQRAGLAMCQRAATACLISEVYFCER